MSHVVMNTPRAATRPNPGSTLAVDHDWYEESITEHEDGSFSIPEPAVQELLDEAAKLVGGTPELKPASWKLGRKPIPGDGEPVFGELEQVPGCFVAFTHSGATLGLVAGELLAGEILTGRSIRCWRPSGRSASPSSRAHRLLGLHDFRVVRRRQLCPGSAARTAPLP